MTVSISSLFGKAPPSSQKIRALSSETSSLFGNMVRPSTTPKTSPVIRHFVQDPNVCRRRYDPHFREVVSRINNKLVITPSASQVGKKYVILNLYVISLADCSRDQGQRKCHSRYP